MMQHVKVFAHRGASGHACENSMEAFEKAIEHQADGIEIDIQCSKDGKLYIYHDLNLKRLTGVNRYFHDCLSEEIESFKLGKRFKRWFSHKRIPSMDRFLEWLQDHPVPINIELKESLIEHKERLTEFLRELDLPKGSHISSFQLELLEHVKAVRPDIETAILVTRKFPWNKLEELTYIDAVHANKRYYKRMYLTLCYEAKKHMRFYAINGNEKFLQNPHPIVAGWITDYPEKVKRMMMKK